MGVWGKQIIKRLLGRFNYQIRYAHPEIVGGVDFEKDIRLLVKNKNPICFDVGANVGQTIESMRKIFDRPRIYSFEPAVEVFSILQSKGFESSVSLHNIALGSSESRQEFINYDSSDMSSFLPLTAVDDNPFRNVAIRNKAIVEVTTLDCFVAQHEIPAIDLLKIDTQGYDLQVLMGAKKSLESGLVRNVLVELNFIPMYSLQCSPEELMEFLQKFDIQLIDFYEKVRSGHKLSWCNALFSRC